MRMHGNSSKLDRLVGKLFDMKPGKFLTAFFVFGYVASILLGALLWPWVLNSWFDLFAIDNTVVWWQGAILGAIPFVGQIIVPVALITLAVMVIV